MTNGIGRVGWRNYVSPVPTIWNNLTHYYSGDNTANDSKGSINGTLVNGATYSTGKINAGFGLDGVNDYVNVGNLFGFDGTTPFSISFIFKLNTNIANYSIKYLVGNQTRTAFPTNGTGAFLYTGDGGANNRLGFAMANNGNRLVVYIKNNLVINTFYHCVVSYNGNGLNSGLNTYINGVSEKLSVFSDSLTLPISSSSQLSTFGSTLGTSDFFNGVIDEVGVWDRALTAADVTELYNAGAGKQYVAPAPTYTTRTAALIAATGITDTTKINAINAFDLGIISNNLPFGADDALYLGFLGDSLKNKYNFIDTTKFELTFLGGWDFTNGMKGNGTNAYAKTGWIPSARAPLGSSYGVYSRNLVTANSTLLSSYTGAGTGYYGVIGKSSTSIDLYNQTGGSGSTWSGLTNIKGCLQSSKLHSSSIQNVSLNTTQSSLTMASSSLSSREVYISTFNNLGVPTSGYYATQDLCCIYLSSQVFTQAQQLTFNSLTNTLLTTLGLNV